MKWPASLHPRGQKNLKLWDDSMWALRPQLYGLEWPHILIFLFFFIGLLYFIEEHGADTIAVTWISLVCSRERGFELCPRWIRTNDIDTWNLPLCIWAFKKYMISAIRCLRAAPSWLGFRPHTASAHAPGSSKVHTGTPTNPRAALMLTVFPDTCYSLKKKPHSSISLCGAIHHVMKSYFMEPFGRRCQDKVPLERPNDSRHGACG